MSQIDGKAEVMISVHSRVSAPSPQGFETSFFPKNKAYELQKEILRVAAKEI